MFSPGLSDSIASVVADQQPCPHCDSSSHIAGGLCVGCLLEAGLAPDDANESETLTDVLAEVNLPDQNWRLGNYEILEELGRGGMGVIYRARQRHSRRVVAVKRVLSYHADSRETLARFRREAQAAASLDHPNILPIYEVSESEDGLPFFSMKFAPGGTLQQVAPALRNDPRQSVALVAKVVRAVQYAHSRGILHRDLKPGNILLDGRGEPLVSDFGLAKWLDTASDLTRTLTIFGTPGYIAPEQASESAAELKPTADIYSLGAILFDLLAGRPPFLGTHALSVICQAADSPAPKLRTLSKLADRDLETICSRCLEREPGARYQSAHDLATDLERWLEGRPIIARPVSPIMTAWRWARRNPKLAALIAGIISLTALGGAELLASRRLSLIVQQAELARHSVAVLPFEDLDEISTTSTSASSATQALVDQLQAMGGVQVRNTSPGQQVVDPWRSDDWKKLGASCGARFIITGTVRSHQGKRRIATRTIESVSGSVIDTSLDDVVVDGEAAKSAAVPTKKHLESSQATYAALGDTNNPEAKSYYERGKEFLFRYNLTDQYRAIESLRKAIDLDPNYAVAHAMLATACQLRSITNPEQGWLNEAEHSSSTALQLTPMLPEAHRAHGGNLQQRGHLRQSIEAYLTAYELDPSDHRAAAILGYTYDMLGRPDIALRWLAKAARRETRPVYADNIASAWASIGEYEKAEKAYRTAAVFRPDLPVGALGLAMLALLRGDFPDARRQCEAARTKYPDNPQPLMMAAITAFFSRDFIMAEKLYREATRLNRTGGVDFMGSVRFVSALGFIERKIGGDDAGAASLADALAMDEKDLREAPDNPRRLYSLAATKAACGERQAALTALGKAVECGWIDYRAMRLDPRFEEVRDTEAFKHLCDVLTERLQSMKQMLATRPPE